MILLIHNYNYMYIYIYICMNIRWSTPALSSPRSWWPMESNWARKCGSSAKTSRDRALPRIDLVKWWTTFMNMRHCSQEHTCRRFAKRPSMRSQRIHRDQAIKVCNMYVFFCFSLFAFHLLTCFPSLSLYLYIVSNNFGVVGIDSKLAPIAGMLPTGAREWLARNGIYGFLSPAKTVKGYRVWIRIL